MDIYLEGALYDVFNFFITLGKVHTVLNIYVISNILFSSTRGNRTQNK